MASIEEPIDNWLIEPASRCLLYLSDEISYASLLSRGVATMSGMLPIMKLARRQMIAMGVDYSALDRVSADYAQWDDQAKQHIADNFSAVHRHSLVGLWCVIESTVENSVLMILERHADAERLLIDAGFQLKGPTIARQYAFLEQQARKTKSVGEAYRHLLSALGVVMSDANSDNALSEINAVRNCILHRGGIVDERMLQQAPHLSSEVGSRITIGYATYYAYIEALTAFAMQMLKAVIASRYTRVRATKR